MISPQLSGISGAQILNIVADDLEADAEVMDPVARLLVLEGRGTEGLTLHNAARRSRKEADDLRRSVED